MVYTCEECENSKTLVCCADCRDALCSELFRLRSDLEAARKRIGELETEVKRAEKRGEARILRKWRRWCEHRLPEEPLACLDDRISETEKEAGG